MFDMSRIIISRIHPIIARSLHGDLRGRSVAAAPRGGAAAAQIKSLGRLRRLVDDSPGPSIRSLLSFACVSPIKSMGYFVRPGLVAVADISATLRVRFPFRVPPERWGLFTRASGCVPRPRSTCVGSVAIGGGGASTGGAGGGGRTGARARRAHRPGALRRRCPRRHRVNRSSVARRRRRERHASRRRAARASLRVRRLGHQRQRRREHARRGRRWRGQEHMQVDRAPVVVVVFFVAFDRSSS